MLKYKIDWKKKLVLRSILSHMQSYMLISAKPVSCKAGLMHAAPLDDMYVCWRQLPTGVTNVCCLSLSLIGDKLYSAENLAWRKSVGAVEIEKRSGRDDSDQRGKGGRGEGGGGVAKEGRCQKRVEFHRAMCLHRRRSRKNGRVARACPFLFCLIAISFAQPGY